MSTLGNKIREARKAARRTQAEVAEELGVSIQAVSQWERDKTVPSALNLIHLSKQLGMSLDEDIKVREMLWHLSPIGEDDPAVKAPLVPWDNLDKWDEEPEWGSDYEIYNQKLFDIHWKPIGSVYALRIKGFENNPTLVTGDIIIIDTGRAPEKGDLVVAKIDSWHYATVGRYLPQGMDKNRAPIFEIVHEHPQSKHSRVISADNPGYVIGTVREHRRYFRVS